MNKTLLKLSECDKARKSAEASIESSKRQAREQLRHLRVEEGQLTLARAKIRGFNQGVGAKSRGDEQG